MSCNLDSLIKSTHCHCKNYEVKRKISISYFSDQYLTRHFIFCLGFLFDPFRLLLKSLNICFNNQLWKRGLIPSSLFLAILDSCWLMCSNVFLPCALLSKDIFSTLFFWYEAHTRRYRLCVSFSKVRNFRANTKQHKMDLCQKGFLLLLQFISGSFLKVTVSEGYDKYVGSQGWKKLWLWGQIRRLYLVGQKWIILLG